jgi:hypothetical protein
MARLPPQTAVAQADGRTAALETSQASKSGPPTSDFGAKRPYAAVLRARRLRAQPGHLDGSVGLPRFRGHPR